MAKRKLLAVAAGLFVLGGFGGPAGAAALRVDFAWDNPGNDVQAGFESFARPTSPMPSPQSETYASSLGRMGTVGVHVFGTAGPEPLAFFDRGDMPGALGDLAEDFLAVTSTASDLGLLLEGLKRGTYRTTTYHHDRDFDRGPIDIEVDDVVGSHQLVIDDLPQGSGNTSPAAAAFTFHVGGPDHATIRLTRSGAGTSALLLNGLVLTRDPIKPGDVNNDGHIDNLDITPFLYALTNDEADFYAEYPEGQYWAADCLPDGNVDNLDITEFIRIIPEPATLLLLGAPAGLLMPRRKP